MGASDPPTSLQACILQAQHYLFSSHRARLSLLAARLAVPAACIYGACLQWYSGAGDTPERRAALLLAALAACAEAVVAVGVRAAALGSAGIACAALGASLGGAAPFWQVVLILSLALALAAGWSMSCCGRAPSCCCVCACLCCRSAAGQPPRARCQLRPRALPSVLARCLCACAAVLLMPALAAQLPSLHCPSPALATLGLRTAAFNEYMAQADSAVKPAAGGTGTGTGMAWQPSEDGVQLLRAGSDGNASYAAWLPASRELFFGGTHTARQLALDLAVTPSTLSYGSSAAAGACGAGELVVHGGFATAYQGVREQARAAVAAALAANASAPIAILGFSLGAAVAAMAALDLACTGAVPPSLLRLYVMAGPGFCSGSACSAALDSLQAAGMAAVRVVNVFDLVPWLPAFLYEPLRTPPGGTLLAFTLPGQYLLEAHEGSGYLPLPPAQGGCAGLRALAWVPAVAAAALAALCAAADAGLSRGGGGGGAAAAEAEAVAPAGQAAVGEGAALSIRGTEGEQRGLQQGSPGKSAGAEAPGNPA